MNQLNKLMFRAALFAFAVVSAFAQAAPINAVVQLGQSVTITVTVEKGTPPYVYQWKKNGVNIPDAVNNRWYIAAATVADIGNYSCDVSNSAGSTTSNTGVLSLAILAPVGGTLTFILGPPPPVPSGKPSP